MGKFTNTEGWLPVINLHNAMEAISGYDGLL